MATPRVGTVEAMPAAVDVLHLVRASVAAHPAADRAERAAVGTFLAEFDRITAAGHDPFDQAHDPVHVTGSAIVVGPRGVILLKHKRLGMWLQPGGHIDAGEAPWQAAVREAVEETGLEVTLESTELVHVDVHDGGRGHTHLDLRYLVRAGDADPAPPPGESPDVHWFDWPAAVARATDARLKSLLARLQA